MKVMCMRINETKIDGLYIIEPTVYSDNRGCFFEVYNRIEWEKYGLVYDFVQDNQSRSHYATIRGLHFQAGEAAQAKLVYVSSGTVLDVAIDLRAKSATFGQHVAVELSDENKRCLLIPRGFAHGFSVLSEKAVFHYKCDAPWCKSAERGIRFDDPTLNIDWKVNLEMVTVSDKDKELPFLQDIMHDISEWSC